MYFKSFSIAGYLFPREVSVEEIKEISKELNITEYIELKSIKGSSYSLEYYLDLTLKQFNSIEKSKDALQRLPNQIVKKILMKTRIKK